MQKRLFYSLIQKWKTTANQVLKKELNPNKEVIEIAVFQEKNEKIKKTTDLNKLRM